MADCEERQLHVSRVIKGAAFMGRDMIGLVAFDFVLRIIFRGVMDVTFVVEVSRVNGNDRP
jgi:hypothetical protein